VPVAFEATAPGGLDGLEVWAVNALHGIRPVAAWMNAGISAGRATRAPRWQAYLDDMTAEVGPLPVRSR
jgi:hypothetical protein